MRILPLAVSFRRRLGENSRDISESGFNRLGHVNGKSRDRRRSRYPERGQSVIEFAFILPLLLLLVFGITELGRMLMQTNVLTQAAREGARAAAVGADSTSAAARAEDVLQAAGITPASIEVAGPDVDKMMSVVVTCNFQVIPGTLLPFSGVLVLRGASAMRFEG
ncbi:MAG: pilus assembly protein [candidate division Zixibacteria bacterium]|nr:pilus assembly protein [candidate division Zixibacteria bacterium]